MGADAPRVLALPELRKHQGAVFIERRFRRWGNGAWALFANESPGSVMLLTVENGKLCLQKDTYDQEWRVWTRRPDEKDRAREAWGRTLG